METKVLRKKVIIKEMSPLAGHELLELLTEEDIQSKLIAEENHPMIMVLPDGRTASTAEDLLRMVQEDIYRDLPSIEVYRLPILIGG